MNTITTKNYEAYIIDFVENTLSNELNEEMLTLLNLNPSIADEVSQFRNLKVQADDSITFDHKTSMMQPESRWSQLRRYMIAATVVMLISAIGFGIFNTSSRSVAELSPIDHQEIDHPVLLQKKNMRLDSDQEPPGSNERIYEPIDQVQIPSSRSNEVLHTMTNQKIHKSVMSDLSDNAHRADAKIHDVTAVNATISQTKKEPEVYPKQPILVHETLVEVAALQPAVLHLGKSPEIVLPEPQLDMQVHGRRMRFVSPSSSQLAFSNIITALIPSIASHEVSIFPTNIDELEVELLPSYIKTKFITSKNN